MFNNCKITINDNHTDIAIRTYKNRIFLVISQFKKFGSLISVTRESTLGELNSETYLTQIIFGKDTDEIHAAARYIAEAINIDRPLLLSLALKDFNLSTLKSIIKAINRIKAA